MYQGANPITKKILNGQMNYLANQISAAITRANEMQAFIVAITDAELTALPSGDTTSAGYGSEDQYAIRAFSTALLNMVEAFNGTTKTGTGVPKTYIGNLKSPLAI
jgi:hypothetical protein